MLLLKRPGEPFFVFFLTFVANPKIDFSWVMIFAINQSINMSVVDSCSFLFVELVLFDPSIGGIIDSYLGKSAKYVRRSVEEAVKEDLIDQKEYYAQCILTLSSKNIPPRSFEITLEHWRRDIARRDEVLLRIEARPPFPESLTYNEIVQYRNDLPLDEFDLPKTKVEIAFERKYWRNKGFLKSYGGKDLSQEDIESRTRKASTTRHPPKRPRKYGNKLLGQSE